MTARRGFAAICSLLLGVSIPASASAQEREASQWSWSRQAPSFRQFSPDPAPGLVALLSLGVPGTGQHVLGRRRQWAYFALEVAGWAFFLERRAAGGDLRDRYRTLAWEQARSQSGTRIDGAFTYYETLTKWTRSGDFDADPGTAGLQPEQDADTFNGSVWALATQIYLGGPVTPSDPAYLNALDYYRERAYDGTFLWDWSGSPGAQQDFADLISGSDDRFRQSTTALGLVIANHLISAADAFFTARGVQPPARIRLSPRRASIGSGWEALVSIPLPR